MLGDGCDDEGESKHAQQELLVLGVAEDPADVVAPAVRHQKRQSERPDRRARPHDRLHERSAGGQHGEHRQVGRHGEILKHQH